MKTAEEMEALGFEVVPRKGGYKIFRYAGENKEVVIPEGVIDIGPRVFMGKNLVKVTFPDSLLKIRESAFYDNELTEIDFKNVQSIHNQAFNNNPIKRFTYNGKTHNINILVLKEVGII